MGNPTVREAQWVEINVSDLRGKAFKYNYIFNHLFVLVKCSKCNAYIGVLGV